MFASKLQSKCSCALCGKRAVVYCGLDAAALCVSCDAQVHGNAITQKHERTLLCELCESRTAVVHCQADSAALCANCDHEIHACNPLAGRHIRTPVVPFCGLPGGGHGSACTHPVASFLPGKLLSPPLSGPATPPSEASTVPTNTNTTGSGGSVSAGNPPPVACTSAPTAAHAPRPSPAHSHGSTECDGGATGRKPAVTSSPAASADNAPGLESVHHTESMTQGLSFLDELTHMQIAADGPGTGMEATAAGPSHQSDHTAPPPTTGGGLCFLDDLFFGPFDSFEPLPAAAGSAYDHQYGPSSGAAPGGGGYPHNGNAGNNGNNARKRAGGQSVHTGGPRPSGGSFSRPSAPYVPLPTWHESGEAGRPHTMAGGYNTYNGGGQYGSLDPACFFGGEVHGYPGHMGPLTDDDPSPLTREERVSRFLDKKRARRAAGAPLKPVRYVSRKAYAEIRPRVKGRFVKVTGDEAQALAAAHYEALQQANAAAQRAHAIKMAQQGGPL